MNLFEAKRWAGTSSRSDLQSKDNKLGFSQSKVGSHWRALGRKAVLPDLFLKGSNLDVEGIMEYR